MISPRLIGNAIRRMGEPVSLNPVRGDSRETKGSYVEYLPQDSESNAPIKRLTLAAADAEGMGIGSTLVVRGQELRVANVAASQYTLTLELRDVADAG